MEVTRTSAVLLLVVLFVGVGVGYGIGATTFTPQLSNLQSELDDEKSEREGLLVELSERDNITVLETKLSELEDNYTENQMLRSFIFERKQNIEKLDPWLTLESQIVKMWAHYLRGELDDFNSTLFSLQPYTGELSALWHGLVSYYKEGQYDMANSTLAEFMEKHLEIYNELIQWPTIP